MLEIQNKLLDRILAQLNGMGAEYAILIEDQKFGTLDVVVKKKWKHLGIDYKQFKIPERLAETKIGDVLVIDVPDDIDTERVRSNLCGRATGMFGTGSYSTCIVGRQVQLIREG